MTPDALAQLLFSASQRANLDARINEIDIQLTHIQIRGQSLYHDMNSMLLAIGGTTLAPATDFQRTLSIERGTPS